MDIFQMIVLGLIQAISEWVPLSSKTMDAIAYLQFFGGEPGKLVSVLLFLHLGTLVAATIYLRKEIADVARRFLASPTNIAVQSRSEAGFLIAALAMTGVVGVPLLAIEYYLLPNLNGGIVLSIVGAGLVVTGFLLSTQHKHKWRTSESATWKDGILVGLMQGISTLPGVSRAGTTTTALIWKGFDAENSFRLSFLLSIPTVFCAEVLLWAFQGGVSAIPLEEGLMLAASSFVFGYLTIGALLRIAQRINVASLAFVFGIIMLVAGLMGTG